ncbi:hypothetical protein A1Q2_02517 [Trichosporon asahii var. asahii CBS 8904]|uniref:Uncharacterized protein n=1 Tax=Trichosporon asahii var. asahii (strain CBS 8904) TaxID=1220162 RepID=K1W2C0_TRIAC|nr:hypothetical protein A1Q2_02517 [Trichosporon asahii var. asahii CBS 8904]
MFTPLVKVEWDLDWDHPYIELVGNPAYRLTPYRRTTSDESVLSRGPEMGTQPPIPVSVLELAKSRLTNEASRHNMPAPASRGHCDTLNPPSIS